MNKKTLIILGVGTVILLFVLKKFSKPSNEFEVELMEVTLRDIKETVSASGKIKPGIEVKIISEVSGQLIALDVEEGDEVTEGQLLARVNPDLYESALKRAQAALNTSKSNLESSKAREIQAKAQFKASELEFERSQKLYKQGAISKSEFDNAQSSFEVAKAEVSSATQNVRASEYSILSAQAGVKEASDNLKRTYIYAPRVGSITALQVEKGDVVTGTGMMSGDELMRVSDLQRMEVDVEVNESDIVRVELGDSVRIDVDAFRDEVFVGIVEQIGNTALNSIGAMSGDQVTNFSVKVAIVGRENNKSSSPSTNLKPGMSASVEIETSHRKSTISVPLRALTSREDTSSFSSYAMGKSRSAEDGPEESITCVFINESGKAVLREVKTGVQDNRYIEILSGLDEEEEVVVGPYEVVSRLLFPGSKLKVKY